jgi:tetratricopeptide (TPR) repeat protein
MTGGAGKFLDFFAHELIPFVEGRYRTAPYRILAGHSLGGLFALSALTERTEIFDAHIAVSPTLGWDDDFALRQTAKLLEGRKELEKALFVTMANEEAGRPSPTRFDRLRKILKRSKATGFVWDMQLMQDEDHGTVVLPAHTWALRKLFDGWRLPLDPKTRRFTGSLSDLGKHYASLEKRFRIGVLPPEPVLNQIGYQHLLDNDTDGALPFFRYAVELYPRSANVHDSLGEALEKSGERKEALESYERAVEAGTRLKDPSLPAFTANRDRLAAANRK